MGENRVTHNSNKAQEGSEMGQDQVGVLCSIYNNMEKQLFTIILENNNMRNILSDLKNRK